MAADRLVGGPQAALVFDDTALPKKGTLSPGAARQYCGRLGKRANCQALVSLTLAGTEVPVPMGLRLPLPGKSGPLIRIAVRPLTPDDETAPCTKDEIALAELDRLTGAGYGASAASGQGLSESGLTWAVGIPCKKVHGTDVQPIPPTVRKCHPVPDQESHAAEAVLANLPWRRVTWRHGTKGSLWHGVRPPAFGSATARPG